MPLKHPLLPAAGSTTGPDRAVISAPGALSGSTGASCLTEPAPTGAGPSLNAVLEQPGPRNIGESSAALSSKIAQHIAQQIAKYQSLAGYFYRKMTLVQRLFCCYAGLCLGDALKVQRFA